MDTARCSIILATSLPRAELPSAQPSTLGPLPPFPARPLSSPLAQPQTQDAYANRRAFFLDLFATSHHLLLLSLPFRPYLYRLTVLYTELRIRAVVAKSDVALTNLIHRRVHQLCQWLSDPSSTLYALALLLAAESRNAHCFISLDLSTVAYTPWQVSGPPRICIRFDRYSALRVAASHHHAFEIRGARLASLPAG